MRTRATILVPALLIAFAQSAIAQQQSSPSTTAATFDIGARASDIDGDAALFQRFRDIRDRGAWINFSVDRDTSTWSLQARGRNVGYRDQRFDVAATTGKVTIAFAWNQTPLFYGNTTSTAYVETSPGLFTLDAAARLAVQNGTALGIPRTPLQAQSASIYRALASPFELRSRRDTASLTLAYAATSALTVNVGVNSYARSGAQPWGAAFGFSALPELPLRLDNRTTDVTAGAEWANRRGMLRIAYEGSYFDNDVETLTWDNPLRATDYDQNARTVTGYDPNGYVTGNGGAQGRMALAPSNHAHGVTGLGLIKLPSRTSLSAGFGVVGTRQDAALIPWTINPVIADPRVYDLFPGLAALDRTTADAEVRVTNAHVQVNSRPARRFAVTGKYRYFERDDRTDPFDATDYVRLDAVPVTGGGITRPLDLTRHTVNVDATLTPIRYTALRVGVGRDMLDHARAYARLADTTYRASLHMTGQQYIGLRAMFEHTRRDGSRFDAAALDIAGVQPASRWYDDADRKRNRATVLVDLMPMSVVGINASAFVGEDRYDEAGQQFGLLNNDNTGYAVGLSIAPGHGVSFAATYGYERYTALQRSRSANPLPDASWNDPDRDWTLDSDETVHTAGVTLDLIRTVPRTEIRLGYDWTDSDQGFIYAGPRIDALAAVGQFIPLPSVTNAWQRATIDVRYFLNAKVGVGAGYWFNKFDIDDYQTLDLSEGVPRTDYVGSLMLGYGYRPFNANTGFIRVFYLF